MDKAAALEIARLYADVVVSELSPDRVLLYGSYAKGEPREDSDIDIAVVFDGFEGDWFQTCVKLARMTREVSSAIEPVLMDLRDNNIDFVQEVLQTGEVVYSK